MNPEFVLNRIEQESRLANDLLTNSKKRLEKTLSENLFYDILEDSLSLVVNNAVVDIWDNLHYNLSREKDNPYFLQVFLVEQEKCALKVFKLIDNEGINNLAHMKANKKVYYAMRDILAKSQEQSN